jgi:hypothetical protein
MNLLGGGKVKFVFQSHLDKKQGVARSDTEKQTIRQTDNVKTSPSRQARKKSELILQGKLSTSPGSQKFHP